MLVEPSGPRVPAGPQPTFSLRGSSALSLGRAGVAAAAIALSVTSRGAALLLVAVLVVLASRPLRMIGVAGAVAASCLRWGTTSLGPIAGAQAVLGPAGWTGGATAVTSAWAGALALICAVPGRPPPSPTGVGAIRRVELPAGMFFAAPFGFSAGLVLAGPGPGGELAVRAAAALIATTLAVLVALARHSGLFDRRADLVAACAGMAAAALGALVR